MSAKEGSVKDTATVVIHIREHEDTFEVEVTKHNMDNIKDMTAKMFLIGLQAMLKKYTDDFKGFRDTLEKLTERFHAAETK